MEAQGSNQKVRHVDLALPKSKMPTALADFGRVPRPVEAFVPGYAIGSSTANDKVYHSREDLGLFQCVFEAWKNHWNLRTSPDDWWFPVACRIAKGIDKAAKKGNKQVRDLFVSHEGKKEIAIDVPVYNIYQVDYEWFFSAVTSEIQDKIKVPAFASTMQNDFSTSSTPQQIASQINLMASMQEFFSYSMGICGCGLKGVELLGEQEDWDRLVTKLHEIRKMLKPIPLYMPDLDDGWFDHVETVFRNLAKTFAATKTDDQNEKGRGVWATLANSVTRSDEITNFWADILMVGKGWKYGPSGIGGHEVEEYNGWLICFLTGQDRILKEDMHYSHTKAKFSGLNEVPMKVSLTYVNPPISDNSQLMAGIMGFRLHEATFNQVPSLEPNHMWAMKLPRNSPLRGRTTLLETCPLV